jgi:hypothetical protein
VCGVPQIFVILRKLWHPCALAPQGVSLFPISRRKTPSLFCFCSSSFVQALLPSTFFYMIGKKRCASCATSPFVNVTPKVYRRCAPTTVRPTNLGFAKQADGGTPENLAARPLHVGGGARDVCSGSSAG